MSSNNNIYSAIEISNGGVKLLVGYYYEGKVYVLHALQSTEASLSNGFIDDIDSISMSIKEVVNSAESQLGQKITDISLCLPPIELDVISKSDNTTTMSADSIISQGDIVNVTTKIKKVVMSEIQNKRIVSILPFKYALDDGQTYRILPKDAVSNTLTISVDCHIIDDDIYQSYKEAVEKAGLRIINFLIAPYATVKLIESYQEIPAKYVLIDIGAKSTTISSIKENRVLNGRAVSFGGTDIIKVVAKEFNISYEKAFHYIEVYGLSKNPSFSFKTEDGFTIEQLSSTIKRALNMLVSQINVAIGEYDLYETSVFIVSGGVANLYGLDDFLAETFHVNVMVFTPDNYGARNKSYTNLLGMIKYISLNPPKNYQTKNSNFTLTRIAIPKNNKQGDDDESL